MHSADAIVIFLQNLPINSGNGVIMRKVSIFEQQWQQQQQQQHQHRIREPDGNGMQKCGEGDSTELKKRIEYFVGGTERPGEH